MSLSAAGSWSAAARGTTTPPEQLTTKMKSTHLFVQGPLLAIDEVNPQTGKSAINGETLEQIQTRYPGATIEPWESWLANKEHTLCTAAEEITEERFFEMLEVLPPQNWQHGKGVQSFEMLEHTSGRITGIYCKIGAKFYGFQGLAGSTLAANVAHCQKGTL